MLEDLQMIHLGGHRSMHIPTLADILRSGPLASAGLTTAWHNSSFIHR